MIANFVGEVLFSADTNGLERLTTNMPTKEKRSVIDFIKDFIAHIKEKLTKVKGVSSEILSLERKFNKLLSTAEQNKIADEGGDFSIAHNMTSNDSFDESMNFNDINELRSIGRKSISQFTDADKSKARKWEYQHYKSLGTKSPFFRAYFVDWRAYDKINPSIATNIPQFVDINTINRTIKNNDTGWEIQVTNDLINDSIHYANKDKVYIQRLLSKFDNILSNAILLDSAVSQKGKNKKEIHHS